MFLFLFFSSMFVFTPARYKHFGLPSLGLTGDSFCASFFSTSFSVSRRRVPFPFCSSLVLPFFTTPTHPFPPSPYRLYPRVKSGSIDDTRNAMLARPLSIGASTTVVLFPSPRSAASVGSQMFARYPAILAFAVSSLVPSSYASSERSAPPVELINSLLSVRDKRAEEGAYGIIYGVCLWVPICKHVPS
ncbi:hypothetical protein H4582DRAFT_1965312 [Lactarius indigo]|nr:hypothetical protein H4582DRAFT_1965312 [Lactarius indigo]